MNCNKSYIKNTCTDLCFVVIGAPPLGGGEVVFKCPTKRHLRALHWIKWGLVKRVRGIVYALRVSPTMANRTVEAAKGVCEYIII